MKTVTAETFTIDVLRSDKPVLVEFWAEWCTPCRRMEPVLEEIAGELGDQVEVVRLDADTNPQVALDHHVEAVPTLTLFRNGRPVRSLVGLQPKSEIISMVVHAGGQSPC
jgi:thioredoxin